MLAHHQYVEMENVKMVKIMLAALMIVVMNYQVVTDLMMKVVNQAVNFTLTIMLENVDGNHPNQVLKITNHHFKIIIHLLVMLTLDTQVHQEPKLMYVL